MKRFLALLTTLPLAPLAGKLVSKDAALKNVVKSRQFGMNRGGSGATTATQEPK